MYSKNCGECGKSCSDSNICVAGNCLSNLPLPVGGEEWGFGYKKKSTLNYNTNIKLITIMDKLKIYF